MMKRFFTFTVAAALAASLGGTSWSQNNGAGATGGGAGAAGGGTAGATGTAGVNAGTNTLGTSPAGAGAGVNTGTAGNPQAGTPTPGVGAGVGVPNSRNPGLGNRANAPGIANPANRPGIPNISDGISQTPFFADPGVRQQLNLNNTQYNSLNRAYQNAYNRYAQSVNGLNSNLTPQQREMQMQQLQSQFDQNLSGTVNSTLTNPQTMTRYNQLNRQFTGVNAFNDPAVRKQLNLSQDQIRQLRTLQGTWRQQLQQFRTSAGKDLNSAANLEQWNRLNQQYASQLNGVLTPQQQQMWSQQTGEAYSFPPNVYFGQEGGARGNFEVGTRPEVDPRTPAFETFRGSRATPNETGTVPPATQAPAAQPATQAPAAQPSTAQGNQGGTTR